MKFIFEQGGNFEFHSNLLVMDFVLSLFLSLLMSSAIYLNDKIFENVKEGDQRNTTSYDFAAFYEEPSISRFIDTVHGFTLVKIMTTKMATNYPPSGGTICLSQISIHYFATTLGGNLRNNCCCTLRKSSRIATP